MPMYRVKGPITIAVYTHELCTRDYDCLVEAQSPDEAEEHVEQEALRECQHGDEHEVYTSGLEVEEVS